MKNSIETLLLERSCSIPMFKFPTEVYPRTSGEGHPLQAFPPSGYNTGPLIPWECSRHKDLVGPVVFFDLSTPGYEGFPELTPGDLPGTYVFLTSRQKGTLGLLNQSGEYVSRNFTAK